MAKFVKQTNDFNCGPTAILNALKWAGLRGASAALIPSLELSCRVVDIDDDALGTADHDFDRTIRYCGQSVFDVKRKKNVTIPEIIYHLTTGGAIAVGYEDYSTAAGGHFTFISGMSGKRYVFVNDGGNGSTKTRNETSVKRILSNPKTTCWFLTKKQAEAKEGKS